MNNNILITGITSGIGLAMAKKFIALGYNVIGCGRNEIQIARLQQEYGAQHDFSVVDVRDNLAVVDWSQRVYAKYAEISIIINNAGTKSQLVPLWQVTAEDFAKTIETNIIGVANIIRSFVPRMVSLNRGVIINFSSEWGRTCDANVASYCASKFAIEGLTKSLAKELPDKMAVVALSPLIVYTELLEKCKDLLLPGEYELGVSPDEWANFAVPKMLLLNNSDNGSSLTWSPKID